MPTSTARHPRPRRTRQPVDAESLARRVLASGPDGRSAAGVFPSERELAKELGVSRHAVRSSMDYLVQRGAVQRLPGGGAVRVSNAAIVSDNPVTGTPSTLRCINFLQGPAHMQDTLQWLMQEYLVGYTEVLDFYELKTRFLYWADDREEYEQMFWPQAPHAEQGCVLLGRRSPNLLQWLNDQRVPYVVQNHAAYDDSGLPPHHRVYVNKIGGAFEAVQHLLDLGHRTVGFVGIMPDRKALMPGYEGWQAAMHRAGLVPSMQQTMGLYTEELDKALGQCKQYLSHENRPTAVFGDNGAATAGLYMAARALGLRVPEDISIIGFDGHVGTPIPQLSVVHIPRRGLGHQAVELLLEVTRKNISSTDPQVRVLPCKLELNGTTGPAN